MCFGYYGLVNLHLKRGDIFLKEEMAWEFDGTDGNDHRPKPKHAKTHFQIIGITINMAINTKWNQVIQVITLYTHSKNCAGSWPAGWYRQLIYDYLLQRARFKSAISCFKSFTHESMRNLKIAGYVHKSLSGPIDIKES